MEFNQLWALGRRSRFWYLRFYPNPGFMIPIGKNKRLKWSKFYGWKITRA